MKRKAVGIVLFCLVLLAAIVAGYWDMLTAEKLRVVRNKASDAVGEIAAIVRTDDNPSPPATPAPGAVPPAAPAAEIAATPPATGAPAVSAPNALPPPASAVAPDAGPDAVATSPAPAVPVETSIDAPLDPAVPNEPPNGTASVEPPMVDTPSASPAPDRAPEAVPAPAAAPSPEAPLAPPTFDILRVEPDGSTVLAGRAPAGATVTLREGDRILGSETANADGAFVIVLPQALSVGDHQMRIQAETADGRRAASIETAVVSIPEKGREGELLAMVETPDQASRLISIPSAPADVPEPRSPAPERLPAASAPDDVLEAPVAGSPSPGEGEGAGAVSTPTAPPVDAAEAASLAVEAVEIEDDTIYVAGRASSGASVRIYIDNDFLAEDRGLADERFLVTAKTGVSTGEHTVRADALDAAGTVIARVEVPFVKPEGRTMAAISSNQPPPEAPGITDAMPEASAAPLTSADAAAEAEAIPADDDGQSAAASVPSAVQRPDGSPPTSGDPNAPSATDRPPPSAAEPPAATGAAASATAADGSLADRLAAADLSAPAVSSSAAPSNLDPARIAPDATETETAAVPALRAAPPPAPAAPSLAIDAPAIAVTRQPALEPAPSRVIIRRGDTLWRISRETYGLGRRYTVIYLANGDQIRDPDRIYPGQVFRVPEDEANDAEKATPPG